MDSTPKKKLILPLVLLVLCLGYLVFDRTSHKAARSIEPIPPQAQAQSSGRQKSKERTPQAIIAQEQQLDTYPSPFALLTTSAIQADKPLAHELPEIPKLPSGKFPGLNLGIPQAYLEVRAILYQPGSVNNVAILADGTGEEMVREGTHTPWGFVSSITQNAVILNGKEVLTLNHSGMSFNPGSGPKPTIPDVPIIPNGGAM